MKRFLRLFAVLFGVLLLGTGTSHALQGGRAGTGSPAGRQVPGVKALYQHRFSDGRFSLHSTLPRFDADDVKADLTDDTDEDDEDALTASKCAAAGTLSLHAFDGRSAALRSRPPTYALHDKHFAFSATPRFLALQVFRL